MNAFEWASIVGAAAWVPQVVGWVGRFFTKPILRVIPSRAPEIGYTSLGPIFNLNCAISAERKDGIIERITAQLTHERGQNMEFYWISLNETFSQVRSAQGIAEVTKNQHAIALKVGTLVLTEKQIGMQERSFDQEAMLLINVLTDQHNHLKSTHPQEYQNLTLKSKEFADFIAFAKKRFSWQEGSYSVRLELRIAGVKEPTIQMFHFKLTKNDVERLKQNLNEIERYIRDIILPPAEGSTPNYSWNWAYPPFKENTSS